MYDRAQFQASNECDWASGNSGKENRDTESLISEEGRGNNDNPGLLQKCVCGDFPFGSRDRFHDRQVPLAFEASELLPDTTFTGQKFS